MVLVMFDFDGTITKKDTLFSFTSFAVGRPKFIAGLVYLFFPLLLNRINVLSAKRTKEIFLTYFFKNITIEEFNSKCVEFDKHVLPSLIKRGALDIIESHQNKGNKIIIISASLENWIKPWASNYNIEVIATKPLIEENRLTGLIDGENINGEEKVKKIIDKFDLSSFQEIIGYGDSKGDLPMLALANKKFYRTF
jgi:phosphatidylglycerophosphatase C